MDSKIKVDKLREFLDYWKTHVDPNDQLPVRVPSYNLTEEELTGEIMDWAQQYLLQMKCPQVLLEPIINEVLQETRKSCLETPIKCGLDGQIYNPLKLSSLVISHTNNICGRLQDNAELNEILSKISMDSLASIPQHSVKAIKNSRRKMEDRYVCISDFNGMFSTKDTQPTCLYAVFDGHGGQDAASYAAAHIPYKIAQNSNYPRDIYAALMEVFSEVDEAFIEKSNKHSLHSGTTALVCIYRPLEKRLYVAWVGDSQALLVCEGKMCQIVSPHRPSNFLERGRIEHMGGFVLKWDGSYRVNGQLAISRAIGDASHKPYISSEPEISTIPLDGGDDFLIIASDGLWDSVSEDYIASFVYQSIVDDPGCADTIADRLVERARKGISDNITVIVVFFKDPHLIAKSTWPNKMEAAYGNSTDSAFENDTKLPDEIKCSYTEPDAYMTAKSTEDVPDNCQNFEDDFGPETDVDTLDDAHPVKSPPECPSSAIIDDSSLINGVKPSSLENKIIQHLTEHNKDFLADSIPFGNDHEGQYSNQSAIENQMLEQSVTKSSDINSEAFVDNKIIDALESLESVISDEKFENERSYSTKNIVEIVDFSEKVDYIHEKSIFSVDNPTDKSTETFYHTTHDLESKEDHDRSLSGLASNLIEVDAACAEGSVEEESEEEEEWNYFKADKDTSCPEIEATNEAITSEPVIESTTAPIASVNPVDDSAPVCTAATSEVEAQRTDEKHEPINELDHSDHNEKDHILDDQIAQHNDLVNSIEKESVPLSHEKDLGETQVADSCVDVAEATAEYLDLTSACEKPLTESTENTNEQEATTALINAEGDSELREQNLLTPDLETSVNGQVERPNNLNLEMASRLNPEAKEFVPTGSPSRSNPSSPSSSVPRPLQNSYLMLSDDIVIAQSPKKGSDTMDNIDVPTENEFQKEMDSRPHELEKASEYLNGNNAEGIGRAHSPGSEPSYQEMNLKEAMQCDEKLDFEYNDEKQAIIEDTSTDTSSDKNLLNILVKEQNAMNMSFYEGRDEALLPTKTDELNKVQILPNDDDISQDNVEQVLDDIKFKESITSPVEVPVDSAIDSNECINKQTFDTSHFEADPHTTGALVHDNPPSAILTIATQVVNDVTALVDEMLIDSPKTDILPEEIRISQTEEEPAEKPDEITVLQVPDENKEILVNIDNNPIEKTSEGSIEVEIIPQDSSADHYTPIKHEVVSPSSVTDELISPILDVQQEIVAENEFIMDESVLNVSSPVMEITKNETNDSSFTTTGTIERHYENEINCFLQEETSVTDKHVVEPITSLDQSLVAEEKAPEKDNFDVTKASEIMVTIPSAEPPISNENKSVISKSATSKTSSAVGKSSKLAVVGTEKKTSTTNKPLIKASTKPVSAAKPATSPNKKITAVSTTSTSTSIIKSSSASKAAITSTARTSSSSVSKVTEKKILPAAKKPPAGAVNGETKPLSAVKKAVTSTVKAPLSKPVSSSLASSRPLSTTTTKPLGAAATMAKTASISSSAKTTSTAPSRPNTTTTRTSTLSAKPRTTATAKSVSSTTTLTSTSKTSHVPSTVKRISNVQNAPLKTNVSSKNTTITKTTTVPSRTSVASKPGSTPAGARKAAPIANKKPSSSPATKITTKSSLTGKSEPSKVADLNHSEIIPSNDNTKPGLLDKQLKNDNNELITKNGIDSPVMVIDSAAD